VSQAQQRPQGVEPAPVGLLIRCSDGAGDPSPISVWPSSRAVQRHWHARPGPVQSDGDHNGRPAAKAAAQRVSSPHFSQRHFGGFATSRVVHADSLGSIKPLALVVCATIIAKPTRLHSEGCSRWPKAQHCAMEQGPAVIAGRGSCGKGGTPRLCQNRPRQDKVDPRHSLGISDVSTRSKRRAAMIDRRTHGGRQATAGQDGPWQSA